MKLRSIIMGALLLQCAVFAQFSSECPIFSEPNDYIDDPSTLENGLFECGDPNLTEYDFTPPIYWDRIPNYSSNNQDDCYAGMHSFFEPNKVSWEISSPFEGDFFVLLSTGGFDDVSDGDIKGSKISQKVYLSAGDAIIGAYFFGTFDWPEFNDYCRIYAEPDPNEICGSEFVINGGFESDTSWTKTGLWTISEGIAKYNAGSQTAADSTLSQTIAIASGLTYLVSIDVLTGAFGSGSDSFLVTLGDETYNMMAYTNTTITQLFTPTSGNTLTIFWANEGTINIDNVSVQCPQYPAEEFTIIFQSVGNDPNDIDKFGSTEDWIPFEYLVEPNQVGPYFLRCEVVDFQDTVYNSYLAVDGFRICKGGVPDADLNRDCDVNLEDYSIFSEAWLSFCPDDPNGIDPNDITDPNIPCQLADFDNSWYVDSNDLIIMFDPNQWLINSSSE